MSLGEKMKKCMKEMNMTARELAIHMGTRPEAVHALMRDECARHKIETYRKLSIIFAKPVSYFLDD